MAVVGATFGVVDSGTQESETNRLTVDAKALLAADAYSPPPVGSAGQTHDYIGVAKDVGNGMLNEVINHSGQLMLTAGESAVAGYVFRLAPPPVRIGLIAAGGLYSGYQIGLNAPTWINDASTVVNASSHSAREVAQAHVGLEHFGGGVVELAVGASNFQHGMYAPEAFAAARSGYLGYRSGALRASEVIPSIKDQFRVGAEAVNWNESPPWIKQATESIKSMYGK